MQTIIITSAAEYSHEARAELTATLGPVTTSLLAPGVLAAPTENATASAAKLAASEPIFIRHLVAATHTRLLHGPAEARRAEILAVANDAAQASDCARDAVGVQFRVLEGTASGPTRAELWQSFAPIADDLFQLNTRLPTSILSVVVTEGSVWAGFNPTATNLSAWAGGARHFAHGASDISRAGFKLDEALESFGLKLERGQRAADLGAAPGGWTAVLAGAGVAVDAVDPARLDPRVLALPGVSHHRYRTDRYLATVGPASLDLIVNDMRIDASEAAELLVALAPTLRTGGFVISTLKLPKHGFVGAMKVALARLAPAYEVKRVRHLFHNRSEVTALLVRR